MLQTFYYCKKTKFAEVMFLHMCHSVHRAGVCLSACWDTPSPGEVPPAADTTPRSRHHPQGTDTPTQEQTPPGTDPLEQTPLGNRHAPGAETSPREK